MTHFLLGTIMTVTGLLAGRKGLLHPTSLQGLLVGRALASRNFAPKAFSTNARARLEFTVHIRLDELSLPNSCAPWCIRTPVSVMYHGTYSKCCCLQSKLTKYPC
jgi:hypothetical protein